MRFVVFLIISLFFIGCGSKSPYQSESKSEIRAKKRVQN